MSKRETKTLKKMNREKLKKRLSKFLDEKTRRKVLKHLTYFKEYIDVPDAKQFGDRVDPDFSIVYVFDGEEYDVAFDIDYSGNAKSYTWIDDFEFEDGIHYIFRQAICDFLEKNY